MTKILVIEDNDDVREEIVAILRYEGFEVRDAENGRLGLALAREWRPDLVVCDLMMPELDGYATLEAIRADPATAAILFLCLTARAEHNDVQKAVELGTDDYLTKPFTADELLARIAGMSAKRAGTDANPAGDAKLHSEPSVRASSRR
jgi:DNA-binding response OmpR family regulator